MIDREKVLEEIKTTLINSFQKAIENIFVRIIGAIIIIIVLLLLMLVWGVMAMLLTYEVAVIWLFIVVIFSAIPIGLLYRRKTKQYDELIKECITEEEVSKEHFNDFEAITLSFENIFNTNKNPLVKIFNKLYAKIPELLSYNNRLKDYISRSYNNYIKRLKKFDGTKECFELLVNEFENVFFAYEALFVTPIEKRKDEIAKDKNLKSEFNKFATEYEHRRMQYKDYGEKMNRLIPNIIRTDFDAVVTL